jgi:selenide,water dikinase
VVLRRLRKFISKELDVRLVNPGSAHLYSGMVPGVVAGHYAQAAAQIDLARLAASAGAELVEGSVQSIDAAGREVHLADGRSFGYDYLSINIGAWPNFGGVRGAFEHATPAKPFARLLEHWRALRGAGARIAIAGAGPAGVELAMAMKHAGAAEVTLYSDRFPFAGELSERVLAALDRNGVSLKDRSPVLAVEPGPLVVTSTDRRPCDAVFWAAGTTALPLIAAAGLATDAAGYALVDASLRSVSHPQVFAAGDCATLAAAPHPRSGVYAVRHGAVLAENLMRVVRGMPPIDYAPQPRSLVLLSCGARYAIAARGGWSAEGAWAWRWKDWIDRRWIRSFG